VEAEGYWWHLARLRESTTRELAAEHAQSLARTADHIAAALTGTPGTTPDTGRDPLAWTDLATYLTRLALALHGGRISPEDRWETSDGDYGEWEDLAAAVTRREFAAAWHPIKEIVQQLAAPVEDGDAPSCEPSPPHRSPMPPPRSSTPPGNPGRPNPRSRPRDGHASQLRTAPGPPAP
jgi:hypothetical protein